MHRARCDPPSMYRCTRLSTLPRPPSAGKQWQANTPIYHTALQKLQVAPHAAVSSTCCEQRLRVTCAADVPINCPVACFSGLQSEQVSGPSRHVAVVCRRWTRTLPLPHTNTHLRESRWVPYLAAPGVRQRSKSFGSALARAPHPRTSAAAVERPLCIVYVLAIAR